MENNFSAQAIYIEYLVKAGHKTKFATHLFGKVYLWMLDPESGTYYLERCPEEYLSNVG